jgi:hypothetical protein
MSRGLAAIRARIIKGSGERERVCNALLMNTKNFIKDCLYIKLSTKLCPIKRVASPRRAPPWKLLAQPAFAWPRPTPTKFT